VDAPSVRCDAAAFSFDTGRGVSPSPGFLFRHVSRFVPGGSRTFSQLRGNVVFMNDRQTAGPAENAVGAPSQASSEPQSVHDRKRAIRREIIALRRAMPPEIRSAADAAINRRLLDIVRTEKPSVLVAYVSDGTEPDLAPVLRHALQEGIALCLPRFTQDGSYSIVTVRSLDFPASHWGIPEPSAESPAAPPELLAKALWLVPGVAFDAACRRLGRGKGVYDRLLARGAGKTIGIFYELQRRESLPHEPTDRPVGRVVTESGVFGCTNTVRS